MWARRTGVVALLAALALASSAHHARAQAVPGPSPSPEAAAPPREPAPPPPPTQNTIPAPSPSPVLPEPLAPSIECTPQAGACVSAGQIERLGEGHSQFRGFVDLLFGDTRIQTDQLDLYEMQRPDGGTARRLVAEGNVLFMRGEERLSGEKLDMELDTSRGTFQNAFGYVSPGVMVEGKRIERLGEDLYRIEDGKFTSCMQPSPRWSFSASSATIHVDDKVKAKNVLFKVKDVPAFYAPYFVYPIQSDQRSTGFLLPHYGNSDARGFDIGDGFFWAMSRSFDQTFYVDHYSKYGWGYGHEFRYRLPSPSRGTFRTFLFHRSDGNWEHDFNWDATQALPGKVRVSLRVEESSTVQFQEQFQENLDVASRRSRYWTAAVQRGFGPVLVQLQANSTDTYFYDPNNPNPTTFDRRRNLPLLMVSESPRKIGHTGIVFGFDTRGEGLQIGNQDHVDKYSRFDVNPRLSRPFSRPFIQFIPQVQYRYTHYGNSIDTDTGELVDTAIERKYWEGDVEMRGPSFSRVFNTPGNFYSPRFKHVIAPQVTYTYRTKFEEFDSIPRFDYLDFFPGTNEIRYGLIQQLYAKRPGRSGKLEPYEFINWQLYQTYYVDIANAQNQFDPNYSSAVFGPGGAPAHKSPLQSRLRIRPTPRVSTNFDLEYDVNFHEMRSLSLSTNLNYDILGLDARWYRGTFRTSFGDPGIPRNTVRASAKIQVLPNRLTLAGSSDYDVTNKHMVQYTSRLRYDVQCCGFVAEMVHSDYNFKQTQFRFSIELANIGSMGSFLGQDAIAANRSFLSGP